MANTSRDIRKLIENDKVILQKIEQEGDAREALEEKIDKFLYHPDWNKLYEEWKLKNQAPGPIEPPPDEEPPGPVEPPQPEVPGVYLPPNINLDGTTISTGTVLFDSNIIWKNGKKRAITKHHEFDPFDDNTEVAAGGHGTPRKFLISGEGWAELSGGMSRVYNWSSHTGKILILQKFIFNKTLTNMSYEFYSRHNEPMPTSNKIGGMQCALELGSIGSKFESFHKDYHDNGDKDFAKRLSVDDVVSVAIVGNKEDNNYNLKAYIDYSLDNKYKLVANFNHIETQNKEGTKKQPLYWRFRTNGTAPKDVRVWDTYFIQL